MLIRLVRGVAKIPGRALGRLDSRALTIVPSRTRASIPLPAQACDGLYVPSGHGNGSVHAGPGQ